MYDNSKQLMNDFMGGYRDDQYSNFNLGLGGTIPLFTSLPQKLARYKGNGKDVRLFQHCYTDSSFNKGWYDVITPNKNKTLRLGLGKKGTTKDDDMSAIYIPSGYDVVIHEHRRSSPNFSKGKHKIIRKSTKCLASIGWNDIVSEIDIIPSKGLISLIQPWQAQVERKPIETLGSYGGGNSSWSTTGFGGKYCYKCVNPAQKHSPIVRELKVGGCDEIKWFKNQAEACLRKEPVTAQAVTHVIAQPVTSVAQVIPTYKAPRPTPPRAPRPVTPQASKYDILEGTDAPVSTELWAKEEEKSMWKNPLVWGAIALVVIGGAYMMTRGRR